LFTIPEFLILMLSADRLNAAERAELFAGRMAQDPFLDVKLARLLPHPGDREQLPPELTLRLLGVLETISPGPRLLPRLNFLTRHADPRIASRASLLVGRRLYNVSWMERQLASADARQRANVVEALWDVQSGPAHELLRRCLWDSNQRVVGNAVVGLHRLGDSSALLMLRALLTDPRREFRLTGVWVAGKIEALELIPLLEQMLSDPDETVRKLASRIVGELRAARRNAAVADKSAPPPAPYARAPEPEACGALRYQPGQRGYITGMDNL